MNDSSFDNICDRFDASWQQGKPIQIEKLLEDIDPGVYEKLLRNLLEIEVEYRIRGGENPADGDYTQRFPQQQSLVAEAFSVAQNRVGPPSEDLTATNVTPDGTVDEASKKHRRVIGPYKLLQQIGEGGMGTVYMAEQSKPVRRRVALKVVKSGLDRKEILSRFEAERQALAMMDHPNIAKVLDAGSTDDGLPYFVMELVHGIPMTDFGPRGSVATTTAKHEIWDSTAGRWRDVLNEEFIWNLQTGEQAGSLKDLELSPSETKDAPIRMIGIKRGSDAAIISEDPSALSMLRRQFGQSLFNEELAR